MQEFDAVEVWQGPTACLRTLCEDQKMDVNKPETLVLYHGPCIDGFTAAWVAWRWLESRGRKAEYVEGCFGKPIPSVKDRRVYMLDFSCSRDDTIQMFEDAKSMLILDHHESAQKQLKGLAHTHFDMTRSGAGMAWDHFFPDDTRPWLINYVEDQDLRKYALPNSQTVNAWIGACPQTFDNWDDLCAMGLKKALEKGKAVETFIDRYVLDMANEARRIEFAGFDNIPVVNAPYLCISQLVEHLSKDALFAIGWYHRGDGKYQYSLRSNGEFDVAALASNFGGGGHRSSAGFTVDRPVHLMPTLIGSMPSVGNDSDEHQATG